MPSSPAASRTSSSATCASRPGRWRTCICPGSTRTRSAASPSSGTTGWRCSTIWSATARSRSTTTGGLAPVTSTARRWLPRSRFASSASTFSASCRAKATRSRQHETQFRSCARSSSSRPRSKPSPRERRSARRRGNDVPRSSAKDRSMSAHIADTAVVYPGTVVGEGGRILEYAVVGKQPTLSPRSTAKREDLPPVELGAGTIVSTAAIVFAGTRLGSGVIVGDQAGIRERCELGDDVVVGRGSLVENDTTIGALTKIQANAYITAYSILEDEVFIAPGVITTNDNFMGRTERRHELRRGPTIRRGARVGGGAVLCPAVEIGEEAYVGAGAVVVDDVPPRVVVVGNPARELRQVPPDELL